MRLLLLYFSLSFLLLACGESTGPSGPQSYTEKSYNNFVIFTATTSTNRGGISVNMLIENTINDYLYPVTDQAGHCMYIMIYDQVGELVLTYSYNYEAWTKLYGAWEIQPGFKYAAVAEIAFYDLPHNIDYGKVQIIFWLERKSNPEVQTMDLSVRFDFNNY